MPQQSHEQPTPAAVTDASSDVRLKIEAVKPLDAPTRLRISLNHHKIELRPVRAKELAQFVEDNALRRPGYRSHCVTDPYSATWRIMSVYVETPHNHFVCVQMGNSLVRLHSDEALEFASELRRMADEVDRRDVEAVQP